VTNILSYTNDTMIFIP